MEYQHFMSDVQIVHDLRLMYRTFTSYGRCMVHSCFMVDIQVTPSPQMTVRAPETDKAQTTTT